MSEHPDLDADERAVYRWQLWSEGFGEEGQRRLRAASVLVSRVGGVGGNLALQLAAAGVGRLLLAHAGAPRPSDLNRQILMSHDRLDTPRVAQAAERLRCINPWLRVETAGENVTAENVDRLVAGVDLVASCAPLFQERLLMNQAAVRQGKPLIDAAMYDFDLQVTTVLPGKAGCLACLYPEPPGAWRREFPVFGAVAGTAGCLGAVEIIKVLAGIPAPLQGELLLADLRTMVFRKARLKPRPDCPVCAAVARPC